MNLSAIFSKTGKGVQEASGKTSHLSRADRAVLSAIDGKTSLVEVQKKFEKLDKPKFEALIQQLDKDGFIREVSSGAAAAPSARPAAPPPRAAPPPPPASTGSDDDMDFTQAIKLPPRAPAAAAPKAPPVDLAASARADADRKAKEAQANDYKTRQEAETKAKAEAELKARAAAEARAKADAESKARAAAEAKAREAAEAKGRADAEAKARAEAEARARAEADTKTRAEADAKVKAAREAAVRMATEAKARAEADAKAKSEAAERDKARLEAELNAKLDVERKAREDAERRAAEAADTARRELEEKSKRDAEEMRQRLEAEMKAKLDAERKAREEEDRKRREEDDRRRKEEDERRAKEDAERRAREEADRKKREDEDRKRREDDERRRREEDERRAKEDAERKKREEDDRKKREEDERRRKDDEARRAKEETERRAKEEAERRALEDTNRRLETDRRAKEEAERKAEEERRAKEEAEAKARAAAASLPKIEAVAPPPPPPPPAGGGIGDSLLADLDSFGKREEEEQREKEEAERKAKEAAEKRAREEAERKAKEEAEKKRRDEEERRRKEEEERRANEEAERKEREEEERRKEEEAERKRKAKEALAAKQAEERAAKAAAAGTKSGKGDDDIGVTDEDLDMDDLKRDQKVAAEKARKTAREQPVLAATAGRPKKWGKPAAIALFVLLAAGIGVLHVMPLSTAEYEKAASDAMGAPVKISSARLSVITGIEVKLEGVSIGDAVKIRMVRGAPEVGSLFGARKSFSRVDLEGVSISQSQIGNALLGKVAGENLRIGRITAKQLSLDGPLKLPPMDLDATVAGDGSLQTVKLTGADKLSVTLSPKGGEIGFDISAGSLAPPFVPALNLSDFAMKGSANSAGITTSEFDGRVFDGVLKGSARVRWGANWSVEGEIRAIGLKVAVFAPTLVSDGRIDGRAAYSMAGSAPATLYESARVQGEFKIDKGVIGSFDLSRALQTGGAQTGGRTVFNELTGQGLYDKGTVQITNATIAAGAMNAGLSLNIDASGGLSGRVVADVKTASQSLSTKLTISGKVQDPVIRK